MSDVPGEGIDPDHEEAEPGGVTGETDPVVPSPEAEAKAEAELQRRAEAAAEEEAERRRIELAHDRDVEAELGRLTRRGFLVGGVAAGAALASWTWLHSRPKDGGIPWPLRRMLELNESVALAAFSTSRLTPLFPPSRITRPARINGGVGLDGTADLSAWRLRIEGSSRPVELTLDEIRALPRRVQITEFRCIEGWSTVVEWAGVRLADLMASIPPASKVRYVSMETPGRGYYVGLDMPAALHPQTLLAYEMNGAPLTWQHGAPLRLAIPVKYGVKNIKRIGTIRYTDIRPADYWAERGYDYFAGL
jgi:DMSO/TMAO reductase YedYZ molybdopterin-dependent catalytic subunit